MFFMLISRPVNIVYVLSHTYICTLYIYSRCSLIIISAQCRWTNKIKKLLFVSIAAGRKLAWGKEVLKRTALVTPNLNKNHRVTRLSSLIAFFPPVVLLPCHLFACVTGMHMQLLVSSLFITCSSPQGHSFRQSVYLWMTATCVLNESAYTSAVFVSTFCYSKPDMFIFTFILQNKAVTIVRYPAQELFGWANRPFLY